MLFFLSRTWPWWLLAVVLAVIITWMLMRRLPVVAPASDSAVDEMTQMRERLAHARRKIARLEAECEVHRRDLALALDVPPVVSPAAPPPEPPVATLAPVVSAPVIPEQAVHVSAAPAVTVSAPFPAVVTAPVAPVVPEPVAFEPPEPVAVVPAEPVAVVPAEPVAVVPAEPVAPQTPHLSEPQPLFALATDGVAANGSAANGSAANGVAADGAAAHGAPAAGTAVPDIKAATATLGVRVKLDDLTLVEGIGPKISQLLREGGIETWSALAQAPIERLQEILTAAGPRYQMHSPLTWPSQAALLARGDWQEFATYTAELKGGRKR